MTSEDGGPIFGAEIREKHFPSRERELEKPSGGAAPTAKSEGKGKRNSEDCVQ